MVFLIPGSKSAENRGDEYGWGHSGGSSVYVHAGEGDYGNSKGYGHGGGHQAHHGAITLDPVSIISLLALGNPSTQFDTHVIRYYF